MTVELLPCDGKGKEDVDLYVDDPMDLVSHYTFQSVHHT